MEIRPQPTQEAKGNAFQVLSAPLRAAASKFRGFFETKRSPLSPEEIARSRSLEKARIMQRKAEIKRTLSVHVRNLREQRLQKEANSK